MAQTTTRAQLADAILAMSFRDLKEFGDNIVDMLSATECTTSLDWATLLSQWAESAQEHEADEVSAAAKAV